MNIPKQTGRLLPALPELAEADGEVGEDDMLVGAAEVARWLARLPSPNAEATVVAVEAVTRLTLNHVSKLRTSAQRTCVNSTRMSRPP